MPRPNTSSDIGSDFGKLNNDRVTDGDNSKKERPADRDDLTSDQLHRRAGS